MAAPGVYFYPMTIYAPLPTPQTAPLFRAAQPSRAAHGILFALLWVVISSFATPGGVGQLRMERTQSVVELVLTTPAAQSAPSAHCDRLTPRNLHEHSPAALQAIHNALRLCAANRVQLLQQLWCIRSPQRCSLGAAVRSRIYSSCDSDPLIAA